MGDARKQLEIYYNFKQSIKIDKNNLNNFTEYQCLVTPKEDILNWKKYYEYDESLFSNYSKFNEWENKIKIKIQTQYDKKPKFKLLKSFNEIKNNLIKGISIIKKDFFFASNDYKVKLKEEIVKCYVGNKKILIEMNNIYGTFFICKVGKKEKTRYITLENVKPYNKLLTNEVMKSKDDDLVQKKFTSKQCQFNYNIFYRMGINKKKENIKKNSNFYSNNNTNNIREDNNNIIIDKKSIIPDFIFETLILLYGLNEDIKSKKKKENKRTRKILFNKL